MLLPSGLAVGRGLARGRWTLDLLSAGSGAQVEYVGQNVRRGAGVPRQAGNRAAPAVRAAGRAARRRAGRARHVPVLDYNGSGRRSQAGIRALTRANASSTGRHAERAIWPRRAPATPSVSQRACAAQTCIAPYARQGRHALGRGRRIGAERLAQREIRRREGVAFRARAHRDVVGGPRPDARAARTARATVSSRPAPRSSAIAPLAIASAKPWSARIRAPVSPSDPRSALGDGRRAREQVREPERRDARHRLADALDERARERGRPGDRHLLAEDRAHAELERVERARARAGPCGRARAAAGADRARGGDR